MALSNDLRAALRTAVQSAVGVVIALGVAATGFINGENVELVDDLNAAYKSLLVIGVGLASAVVTWVGNKVQDKLGVGNTPTYTPAGPSPAAED